MTRLLQISLAAKRHKKRKRWGEATDELKHFYRKERKARKDF
jgi:hypothetical protein